MMHKRLWIGLLTALLLLGPARAETIVVASTGDGAPAPGTRLDEGRAISLPAGARLTLLSQSGIMQVIEGPFDGVPVVAGDARPDDAFEENWSAVVALVGFPDAQSDVMGATRRTRGEFHVPPGLWHVSVDSSGPRCTAPGPVHLWRRAAEQGATLSARSAAGRLIDVAWPAGDPVFALPSQFAKPGRLVVTVDGEMRVLSLAVAPADLPSSPSGEVLSWLLSQDCQRQALTLIRRVHEGLSITE